MNKIKVCLHLNQSFQVLRLFSGDSTNGANNLIKTRNQKNLSFNYPKYESPFIVSINPNYSQWMDRYCTQWAIDNSGAMNQFEKYRTKISKSDCGLFAAVTYPSANWHRCEKLMKWSLIFFICDDYHDILVDPIGHEFRAEPFWNYMMDALNSLLDDEYISDNSCPQFVGGVRQILREIYFDFTQKQIRRSVNMIKDYIDGNIQEKNWTKNELPNWEDYWNARLGSVGGQMALQLIEYAKDIDLSDKEWNHISIQSLNKLVSEEIILVNDYYTFRKEVDENNGNFDQMKHPFALLVHNQGLTLQSAVNKVNELIKEKDKQIIERIKTIEKSNELKTKQMFEYLNGVKEFLGGYWRHAVTARRYHGYDFTGVLPSEGLFIYDKQKTIIKANRNQTNTQNWFKPIPANVQPVQPI